MGEGGNPLKCGSSLPPANGLILHCHGGGFVAQSSKSHEIYLRDWAVALDVPILSIDYSLAPEAPFPRALEEVFYAYCWALNNCEFLGTTAETIILAGDSAGANLNLACTLKAVEMGVRKPDGILLLYSPVLINFVVSPARLLCLMDPLLPFSFMMSCLKAYTCPSEEILEENRKKVAQSLNISKIKSKTHQMFSSSVASTAIDPRTKNTGTPSKTKDAEMTVNVKDDQELLLSDNSNSQDISTWEVMDADGMVKSPPSDISYTMASASMGSGNGTRSNITTPDETNGISFEEDSQPIQKHFTMPNGKEITIEFNGDINLDDELVNDDRQRDTDPTSQYVSDFLDR